MAIATRAAWFRAGCLVPDAEKIGEENERRKEGEKIKEAMRKKTYIQPLIIKVSNGFIPL